MSSLSRWWVGGEKGRRGPRSSITEVPLLSPSCRDDVHLDSLGKVRSSSACAGSGTPRAVGDDTDFLEDGWSEQPETSTTRQTAKQPAGADSKGPSRLAIAIATASIFIVWRVAVWSPPVELSVFDTSVFAKGPVDRRDPVLEPLFRSTEGGQVSKPGSFLYPPPDHNFPSHRPEEDDPRPPGRPNHDTGPNPPTASKSTPDHSSIESVDIAFCGTSPCRVVFPARIWEGESKAQMHLGGVLTSARLLNATFVPPNTDHGHFSSCRLNPFEYYFDVDAIAKKRDVNIRTFSEFEEWILRRNELGSRPSSQMVHLIQDKRRGKHAMKVQATGEHVPPQNVCHQGELDWSRHHALRFYPKWGWFKHPREAEEFANLLITGLTDVRQLMRYWVPPDERGGEHGTDSAEIRFPEVIAYSWHVKYPVFPEAGKVHIDTESPIRLPYAPRWQQEGRDLSSRLSPFIAIHWRMETVNPSNLFSCSAALHEKIREMRESNPDIANVFLLTDFPLEGDSHPHSLSFGVVTDQAREAMADFLENFSERTGGSMKITTLVKELPVVRGFQGDRDVSIEELDMGLVGVIDKVMAEDAEIFLTGVPHRCSRLSSFTKQVVAERREKMGTDGVGRRNEVGYWPESDMEWY